MTVRIIILFFITSIVITSNAQSENITSSDSLVEYYIRDISVKTDSLLYNPNEYLVGTIYHAQGNAENHPYFKSNNWNKGTIIYKGKEFHIPIMKYDIEQDAIITLKTINNKSYPIKLEKNGLESFSIGNHHFYTLDTLQFSGYYELVCKKNTIVWGKWTKAKLLSGQPKYASSDKFIIVKDGQYHEIKNLKQLYNLFSGHKNELKKYKKDWYLKFNQDKVGTVKKLTEYYDTF